MADIILKVGKEVSGGVAEGYQNSLGNFVKNFGKS